MTEVSESRIYVGNLPFSVGFEKLKEMFSQFGEVTEATVIVNHYSGRSKGFGFVTFVDKSSAEKAISEMNEKEFEGRRITVKPAMPQKENDERGPPRDFDRDNRHRRDRDDRDF